MANLATEPVDYRVIEGTHTVTRLYVYPSGRGYRETTSRASFLGWPLLHLTLGRCPETGRRKVARGWVAVGRFAIGGVAVGQLALGLVAVAQLGAALLLGVVQLGVSAERALGQVVVARVAAYGQVAVAQREAVGQVAVAEHALGQVGMGRHVLSTARRDPEAVAHFAPLLERLGIEIPAEPAPQKDPATTGEIP